MGVTSDADQMATDKNRVHTQFDAHIGPPLMAYTTKSKFMYSNMRVCVCVYVVLVCCVHVYIFMTAQRTRTHRFCCMQKVSRKYYEWNLNKINLIRKTNQCVFDVDTIHNLSFFLFVRTHCAIFMFLLGRSYVYSAGLVLFSLQKFLYSSVSQSGIRGCGCDCQVVFLWLYMLPLNGYTLQNIHIQYREKCFINDFLFMRKFSHEEKNAMKIGALI